MEKESTDFIPLLEEDIETPVVVVVSSASTNDSIYPVKTKHQTKECQRGRHRVKKILKGILKVLFVAFLLMSAVATVAGYRWYRWLSHKVQRYTVTESNSFPVQEVPMRELEAFQDNAVLFWDSIQSGSVPQQDFVLTATNVNGFFAASDFLRGNAFAEMKENQYQMSVSLPTDGLPGGKGRFFNGYQTIQWDPNTHHLSIKVDSKDLQQEPIGQFVDIEFELTTMEDGKTLNLELLQGKVFDYKVPKEFLDEHYNLLEGLYRCDCDDEDCQQARKFLEGLAGISMEDGQVVVSPDSERTEATYYKEHKGHASWGHHGKHHGHKKHDHHGKHGGRHNGHNDHKEHGDHHHGEHRALRENHAKNHHAHAGGHRHWKALRMVRKLMA